MSTEHQRYSTQNQADVIAGYAEKRGFEIVRTYADDGKSGVVLNGRGALQQLFNDVASGKADFSVILVYDVSRWGRFQNTDEPAYYEFLCSRAGLTVHYCAEPSVRLAPDNGVRLDAYRFDTLDAFFELTRRTLLCAA